MNQQQTAPPVHLYVESGLTFPDRILCHAPDRGLNTHVTEYGNRVTCEACRALMRANDGDDDVPPNPWAEGDEK